MYIREAADKIGGAGKEYGRQYGRLGTPNGFFAFLAYVAMAVSVAVLSCGLVFGLGVEFRET
jgi:hypothetical protein